MLEALVRIAGATTIVNTAKGFSVNDVIEAPAQAQSSARYRKKRAENDYATPKRFASASFTLLRVEIASTTSCVPAIAL